MNEKEKLRQDLLDLGVTAGDVLLVHSSMKALGTKLSPEEVIGELEAAVGENGTLLLPSYRGKLLFIGDILYSCTFLHGIETLLKPPYIRPCGEMEYVVNGRKRMFSGGDDFGWGSEFQRIEDILEYPDIRKGKLLNASSYLIDSRALLAAALSKMWAEPYAFVTDISKYI